VTHRSSGIANRGRVITVSSHAGGLGISGYGLGIHCVQGEEVRVEGTVIRDTAESIAADPIIAYTPGVMHGSSGTTHRGRVITVSSHAGDPGISVQGLGVHCVQGSEFRVSS